MHHATRRYFEDVELGDELGPMPVTVAREIVVDSSRLWGWRMPNRFTDDEVARRDGLRSPVVPAPLSMALMEVLVNQWSGVRLKRLDTVLRQHFAVGQPARVGGIVTDKNREGGVNEIHCDLYIESMDGEMLIGGQAVVELPSRPS